MNNSNNNNDNNNKNSNNNMNNKWEPPCTMTTTLPFHYLEVVEEEDDDDEDDHALSLEEVLPQDQDNARFRQSTKQQHSRRSIGLQEETQEAEDEKEAPIVVESSLLKQEQPPNSQRHCQDDNYDKELVMMKKQAAQGTAGDGYCSTAGAGLVVGAIAIDTAAPNRTCRDDGRGRGDVETGVLQAAGKEQEKQGGDVYDHGSATADGSTTSSSSSTTTIEFGDGVVAQPVVSDDIADQVRRQVRSEVMNEVQARMSTAKEVSSSPSDNNTKMQQSTRRRYYCLLAATFLAFLAVLGISIGFLVSNNRKQASEELQSDPNIIRGEIEGGRFGDIVVLSRDGSTMAVGADKDSYAQVFRRTTDGNNGDGDVAEWKQIGQTLYGDGQFGRAIDLSLDGSILVVGSWSNDDAAEKAGKTAVFRFNGTMWNQMGQDLLGDASEDRFGYFVTMSENGRRIAVSARNGDPSQDRVDAGYIRVFRYSNVMEQDDGIWNQIGQDLEGEDAGENFGKRLAMTSDGSRLAVSSVRWNENRGRVRIFDFSQGDWIETIQPLEATAVDGFFGAALALTPEGDLMAVGADQTSLGGNHSGSVDVYELDDSTNTWRQHGSSVVGDEEFTRLGINRVALSDDGMCLVVGGPHYKEKRGIGHFLQWNALESDWINVASMTGTNPGDRFGGSSTMSGDCMWVAWGANQKDSEETASRTGYVGVYQAQDLIDGGVI